MKILALTNTPGSRSGYGSIGAKLFPYLLKKHDVRLMANWGLEGYEMREFADYPGLKIYGKGWPNFNEHMVAHNYEHFGADVLLTILDAWVFSQILADAKAGKMVFVPYFPIDSEYFTREHRAACEAAFRIIPMSTHGERMFRRYFPEKTLPHVPVFVDKNEYYPLWEGKEQKKECKRMAGWSGEEFVIGLAGDLKHTRKRWIENLHACSIFIRKHPKMRVGVYIHTKESPDSGADFDVKKIVETFGLQNYVRMTDTHDYLRGMSNEEMCHMYNGFDVFLHCSAGEGGGMQLLESQACGTPVISTDYTAIPQVCGPESSILIPVKYHEWQQTMALKAVPDVDAIVKALEEWHARLISDALKIRDAGVEFVEPFSWKNVSKIWDEVLGMLFEDLEKACLQPPKPTEELKKVAYAAKVV